MSIDYEISNDTNQNFNRSASEFSRVFYLCGSTFVIPCSIKDLRNYWSTKTEVVILFVEEKRIKT